MKIQLVSDLHLEFMQERWPGERLITPVPGADVLVLAGDIAVGTLALKLFINWPVPVLYVHGNHEFYGHSMDPMIRQMRLGAKMNAIHVLENDRIDIGNVRVLGTTLWTDYRLMLNYSQGHLMEYAEKRLNDHHRIRYGEGTFTARQALDKHELARSWLQSELDKPFEGRTVVITHHGPHPLSVHPRYADDPLSAAFVSDLSTLMPKVDLWVHGHVHDGCDYQVGSCRVVANPAGYVGNRGWAKSPREFVFENPLFNRGLLLEVPS